MTVHNPWLAKTRSIPYWLTSVFSSTASNDERRIIAHTLTYLERSLTDESLLRMNYDSFITSRQPDYRSPYQAVPLLFSVFRCHGNLCSTNRCLANGLPLLAFRRCLPKRYLAMDYSVTLFKFIHCSITTFNFLFRIMRFNHIGFIFQIFPPVILTYLPASHLHCSDCLHLFG
jgi:hypothetical protein